MITPPKETILKFINTHGAMSVAEGIALYSVCMQAPEGLWVECGSHKCKSSLMIAEALPFGSTLILVEPEFKDQNWLNECAKRISKGKIVFADCYSTDILPTLEEISFLFIDSGNHGEEIVQSEKPFYEDKIVKGGIIAFHDYGNQFTAVAKCYNELVATGKYEPLEILWQPIFNYVQDNDFESENISWHQYPKLPHPPNFIGALKRK